MEPRFAAWPEAWSDCYTAQAWLTIGLFVIVLIAIAYPLAIYIARIADGAAIRGVAGSVERLLYRAAMAYDWPVRDCPDCDRLSARHLHCQNRGWSRDSRRGRKRGAIAIPRGHGLRLACS